MALSRLLRPDSADFQPVILTQVGVPDPIVVELRGRNAPKKGVVVEDRLRYKKVYYPGNDEATFHILGTQQEPIVFEGRFADPSDLLVSSPDVAKAQGLQGLLVGRELVGASRARSEVLRQVLHGLGLVRVEWGSAIVVEGLLTSVKIVNHSHQQVDYTFTIDPSGPETNVLKSPRVNLLRERQQNPTIFGRMARAARAAEGVLDVVQSAAILIGAIPRTPTPAGEIFDEPFVLSSLFAPED